METDEFITAFRQQLDQVAAQGGQQVSLSMLRAYLDAVEHDASKTQGHLDRVHSGMLAQSAARNLEKIELLKAVVESGKSALQALIAINGGAVIALLGAISHLAGKADGHLLARYLALPLLLFGIGVVCGALGFAFRYLSQASYTASNSNEDNFYFCGDRFRYAALSSAVFGFVVFGFALVNSYYAVVWTFGK